MSIPVIRKDVRFGPDPRRVIARYYVPGGDERAKEIIQDVLELNEAELNLTLNQVLREFSMRHRNITKIFEKHFQNIQCLLSSMSIDNAVLTEKQKLLIGAFFTMEYSIESAAFFNPSIIEDPDQSSLAEDGQRRVIISFRATGEGHISSIVFRNGLLDSNGDIQFDEAGRRVDVPENITRFVYQKGAFKEKLLDMNLDAGIVNTLLEPLNPDFIYGELQAAIVRYQQQNEVTDINQRVVSSMNWLASSHYEVEFSMDTAISERVIFPISYTESRGIEDARFVKFTDDNGEVTYYATYTAYNGFTVLPKLLETKDFYKFKISPLCGKYSKNKGMALFPRKIKGRYVMASRYDGVNNYIMYSDNVRCWDDAQMLIEPKYPWELTKLGNCGSPIETEEGWLLITHGVGPMRKYSLGAILLDLENPSIVISHLKEPLLAPNDEEREGYVPNVVYSCGSIIYNDNLILPYAMSDTVSTYATISVRELLDQLLVNQGNERKRSLLARDINVLLIDDDKFVHKLVHQILEKQKFSLEIASDGVEGLMKLGKKSFDLILLDINMPNMDGNEFMKFIKDKNFNIPVILLSGISEMELSEKTNELGAVGYITKPFKVHQFLEIVQDAL